MCQRRNWSFWQLFSHRSWNGFFNRRRLSWSHVCHLFCYFISYSRPLENDTIELLRNIKDQINLNISLAIYVGFIGSCGRFIIMVVQIQRINWRKQNILNGPIFLLMLIQNICQTWVGSQRATWVLSPLCLSAWWLFFPLSKSMVEVLGRLDNYGRANTTDQLT